jgi:hypothetical protein
VLDEPIYHAEPAESMGHGSIQSLGWFPRIVRRDATRD